VRDKKKGEKYHPEVLSNGDALKQLLVRYRLLLYKYEENWSEKQKQRAALLFSKYSLLEKASRMCGILYESPAHAGLNRLLLNTFVKILFSLQ
jgi:hypothetical protein